MTRVIGKPRGLKQHRFYVYHEEDRVMARMEDLEPVVAKVCVAGKDRIGNDISAAQVAHDEVQKIVNPKGFLAREFGDLGFLHPIFQQAISENCEAFVKAAYAATEGK